MSATLFAAEDEAPAKDSAADPAKTTAADATNDDAATEKTNTAAPTDPSAKEPIAEPSTDETATLKDTSTGANPLENAPSYGEALFRMVIVLIIIVAVLLILAKLLPKWVGAKFKVAKGGTIQVVDTLQIEPRRRVYLLRVGEQYLLVGSSEHGMHTLSGQSLDNDTLRELLAARDLKEQGAKSARSRHAMPFTGVLQGKSEISRAASEGN